MDDTPSARRRADTAAVAGEHLLLHHLDGGIARIAVVVDQLDDAGLRTPLVEDVLKAFPHAELYATVDLRAAAGAPVAGRVPALFGEVPAARPRLFFRRSRRPQPASPADHDHDVVLRIGDRRSRAFTARPEALDLAYILDLEEGGRAAGGRSLGDGLAERCALQGADAVWCGSRRVTAILRRRWQVDAHLLYPPAELEEARLDGAAALPDPRTTLIAVGERLSPAWRARLATLARIRPDLPLVLHGADARAKSRLAAVAPTAERFRALLPHALAVILPPGDAFDPRAVWAQEAGVPLIAATCSAAAETVEGLERRAPTGVLLDELSDEALLDAVAYVERHPDRFAADRLRAHAARWAHGRFRQTLKALVLDAWCRHLAAHAPAEPPYPPPLGAERPCRALAGAAGDEARHGSGHAPGTHPDAAIEISAAQQR